MKPAKIVGYDATDDIAVIKIKNVSNLEDGRRSVTRREVAVSDTVIAIGNALGKGGDPTVTSGIVSRAQQGDHRGRRQRRERRDSART